MTAGTEYAQEYQRAQIAYMNGSYDEAATIVDRLVKDFPSDPSACLLRGHIYCYGLQQYDIAKEQYESVLHLTTDPEFTNYASQGLQHIQEHGNGQGMAGDDFAFAEDDAFGDAFDEQTFGRQDFGDQNFDEQDFGRQDFADFAGTTAWQDEETSLPVEADNLEHFDALELDQLSTEVGTPFQSAEPFHDPFGTTSQTETVPGTEDHPDAFSDPFAIDDAFSTQDYGVADPLSQPTGQGTTDAPFAMAEDDRPTSTEYADSFPAALDDFEDAFAPLDLSEDATPDFSAPEDRNVFSDRPPESPTGSRGNAATTLPPGEDETLFMGSTSAYDDSEQAFDTTFEHTPLGDFGAEVSESSSYMNSFSDSAGSSGQSNVDFLDEFDEFDDLGNLSDFDLSDNSAGFTRPAVGADFGLSSSTTEPRDTPSSFDFNPVSDRSIIRDDEVFSLASTSDQVPAFTQLDQAGVEAGPTVEQGFFAPLQNASIATKQMIAALAAGCFAAFAVALVNMYAASKASENNNPAVVSELRNTGWLMALAGGLVGGGVSFTVGRITAKQMKRSIDDLQTQFNAVSQGNLNARATVYSEDEFGQLATGFNQMSRVILTTTSEAQRKAEEQEQAKEDLQRQVIRLLDDVEGAARGDLTVQAEVTADVLGAVADSFNLTIQNLREIVQQVKVAARQVSKGSTDNEMFARSLSSDALRQAEELAVTLNSVQVMTESIQRVAESAREAEEVARSASSTALKGGEAVERTVAGILQIRETVAETTRKVKRLAESSQEISKIVALISQIASRTNLLALNASIEAARAGEAGRGFAIVADEVRQLADRAAKASKEIEQIVLQIQSETGSVMTAMEEGTQQVIEGTRLAEQAKRALEDIIQVSNRIDVLVQSITADTVEQTETSRAVAQVMQSVELTAQETSQEAQRVSGSLQNLVGVARDLLTSVERFRVETIERK
ncbi:methyl-accepting chemotaxis protein [Leptodesmis sichuanensis]|uniref:methyl-accepting chemotaxis protein n=1 Tax=Leptodesmis sichuanensis TaxID=2906798 RepID=UPI001F2B2762|nr:methyl-accepting chemotaxis protein [Leptodesmis sichuanensis]UIE37406.1 HAMP domain-containing protein [Leptodesmis sichuanensis A121]